MKNQFKIVLLLCFLLFSSCGKTDLSNSSSTTTQVNSLYTLDPFYDVNVSSTLDLNKLQSLPKLVNLQDKMTPVKDQDTRGTCSFFTTIALVESAIKRKMGVEVNLSEEYLNNIVKTNGSNSHAEGGSPLRNLSIALNTKLGFMLERDWPYQPSWFLKNAPCEKYSKKDKSAPVNCFSHNSPPESVLSKAIPAENFKPRYYNGKITTNLIISTLALDKLPLSVGVPVNHKGWQKNGDIVYTEEMRDECIRTPVNCGQHAIVLTGYDLDKQIFYFKNSWGKDWGHSGYGIIPFDLIDRHSDHYLSTVELIKDLDLPSDFDKDPLKLDEFIVASQFNNAGNVKIKTVNILENVNAHTIKIGTSLVKKENDPQEEASDLNTKTVLLTDAEKQRMNKNDVSVGYVFYPTENTERNWGAETSFVEEINNSNFEIPSIKNLVKLQSESLYLRTSIYVYTNTSKFKVIKRTYSPMRKSEY
jgi:hypothetical protein